MAVALPLCAGTFALQQVTRSGMAIYADSVTYICAARSIRSGHGYTTQNSEGLYAPEVLYPPLYSFVLAVASAPNRDVINVARWVQIVLQAIALIAAMAFVGYASGGSPGMIFMAGMFWALATDYVSFEGIVLSEGLFVACTILSIFFLYAYLRQTKPGFLAAAGLMTSATWLSRYAGTAWVLSGALCLLLYSPNSFRRRLRDAASFSILGSAISLYWVYRNHTRGEGAFGRSFHLTHFFGTQQAEALATTFRLWTWRLTLEHQMIILASWLLLISGLVISLCWSSHPEDRVGRSITLGARLLVTYAIVYVAFLFPCAVFFQGDLFSDSERILLPFHLLLLLFVLLQSYGLLRRMNRRAAWFGAVIACSACLFLGSRASLAMIRDFGRPETLMYGSPVYRESPTIKAVLKMSPPIRIYTNLDYPITLFTNKECDTVPTTMDNDTQRPNDAFDAQMQEMREDFFKHGAILVYSNAGDTWLRFPTLEEIKARIPLKRIGTFPDGTIWQANHPVENSHTSGLRAKNAP
jgi:hypothetical protein